ncbi:hypothetical protein C0995_001233, partial [Termitomyces sp. Mi166
MDATSSVPPSPHASVTFVTHKSLSPDPNTGMKTISTRPTPLKLISSNHSSPAPSVPQSPRSPNHQEQRQRQSSAPSPLLHTRWGSAVSSPASAAQYSAIPHTSMMSPNTMATSSTGTSSSPPSMSAYFPRALDALGKVVLQQEADVRKSEKAEDDRRIGIKENVLGREFLPGQEKDGKVDEVAGADEDDVGEDTTFVVDERVLHESPSIASSPETEPDAMSKRRAAP